jgi:glycosyltransferase involved in cell wall biosynthesis
MYPKLSVITINYNDAEGLRNTMNSVFSQSFSDFEYIVVDGRSNDGSIDVILELQARNSGLDQGANSKFQWISEPDSGIYNAMNKGILLSTGEYCFFLNSGDHFVSQNVLQNVMQVQADEDILFGNLLVCQNGKVVEKSTGKPGLTFMDLYLSNIKHQASFIKRNMFDRFGLYNESNKIVSDWEFFLKTVGLQNATYRYIDEDITFFDNAGISNNSHVIRIAERNKILENYIPPMFLADYRYYEKYEFLRPAFKHKFSFLVLRVIAKSAKEFERFIKKQ